MKTSFVLSLLCFVLCVNADCQWLEFHKDLRQSGISSAVGTPKTNNTAWIVSTGDRFFSSPIVADGFVFAITDSGIVYKIDVADGNVMWSLDPEHPVNVRSTPSYHAGMLHYLSVDGIFHAINTAGGYEVCTYDTHIPFPGVHPWDWSSPAAENGKIFFGVSSGDIVAIYPFTNDTWWTTHIGATPNSAISVGSKLLFSGTHNLPYQDPDAATVVALNKATGGIVWRYYYKNKHYPLLGMVNCQGITIADVNNNGKNELYFGVYIWGNFDFHDNRNALVVLDEMSGRELWTVSLDNASSTSSPVVFEDLVIIGSDSGKLYAVEALTHDHKIRWDFQTGGSVYDGPAVAEGRVYFGSLDHINYCLDARTGELIWSYNTQQSRVYSSPAISCDGKVIFTNEDGNVYAYQDAETHHHHHKPRQ